MERWAPSRGISRRTPPPQTGRPGRRSARRREAAPPSRRSDAGTVRRPSPTRSRPAAAAARDGALFHHETVDADREGVGPGLDLFERPEHRDLQRQLGQLVGGDRRKPRILAGRIGRAPATSAARPARFCSVPRQPRSCPRSLMVTNTPDASGKTIVPDLDRRAAAHLALDRRVRDRKKMAALIGRQHQSAPRRPPRRCRTPRRDTPRRRRSRRRLLPSARTSAPARPSRRARAPPSSPRSPGRRRRRRSARARAPDTARRSRAGRRRRTPRRACTRPSSSCAVRASK